MNPNIIVLNDREEDRLSKGLEFTIEDNVEHTGVGWENVGSLEVGIEHRSRGVWLLWIRLREGRDG